MPTFVSEATRAFGKEVRCFKSPPGLVGERTRRHQSARCSYRKCPHEGSTFLIPGTTGALGKVDFWIVDGSGMRPRTHLRASLLLILRMIVDGSGMRPKTHLRASLSLILRMIRTSHLRTNARLGHSTLLRALVTARTGRRLGGRSLDKRRLRDSPAQVPVETLLSARAEDTPEVNAAAHRGHPARPSRASCGADSGLRPAPAPGTAEQPEAGRAEGREEAFPSPFMSPTTGLKVPPASGGGEVI